MHHPQYDYILFTNMLGFVLNKTLVYVWHALEITLDSQLKVDLIEQYMFHAGLN